MPGSNGFAINFARHDTLLVCDPGFGTEPPCAEHVVETAISSNASKIGFSADIALRRRRSVAKSLAGAIWMGVPNLEI
jgi:hypothetical protein